jgi:hypothetical protein
MSEFEGGQVTVSFVDSYPRTRTETNGLLAGSRAQRKARRWIIRSRTCDASRKWDPIARGGIIVVRIISGVTTQRDTVAALRRIGIAAFASERRPGGRQEMMVSS